MNNTNDNGLNLDDSDRLPWLETADGYEYDDGASPLKVVAMVLAALALLAAIVGAVYWLQRNQSGGANGNGEVIAAPAGDYKVKPQDAGGKRFEGEGDSAFAASEGTKTGATLVPAAKIATTAPPAATASAPVAAPATAAPAPASTVMVQLGAFGDSAKADAAWSALNKRFGFLTGMNRKIVEANVEGGRKVFRLQAVTANSSQAQQLCAKLKVAGENCLIVR
ncbi:MAG: sporulation protein [Sphingomonadaceae bacterium PASS1]|nr:MAG: sporulation protein [Sphingomonadaceae bacterium PASS1]